MSRLTIMMLVLLLAGCAAKTEQIENYVHTVSTADQELIAHDAVKKLVEIYPPAKTRLDLQQPHDPFGLLLVRDLRVEGYAIKELVPEDKPDAPSEGLLLRYVLDRADTSLFRLTLTIGSQSVSRPYQEENGLIQPAGSWIHRE